MYSANVDSITKLPISGDCRDLEPDVSLASGVGRDTDAFDADRFDCARVRATELDNALG